MSVPAPAPPALRVTCWGTRGSVPSPGPATVRYGGNTSCVEVRAGERRLILDAGTGIRALSRRSAADGVLDADLFVSHYHWDHIQGFPFLAQLYQPETSIRVYGPRQGEVPIDRAFAGQMSPLYFPIPMDALAAHVRFATANGTPWSEGPLQVEAMRVRHPGVTYGYRITCGGARLVYVPDDELTDAPDPAFYRELVDFVAEADLLLHDAMFTGAEYPRYQGWGHSSIPQAVRLAEDAGVRRLHLFHHAPDRSDAELARLADAERESLAARGSSLVLDVAAEGEEIALAGGRP